MFHNGRDFTLLCQILQRFVTVVNPIVKFNCLNNERR